jgi:hypothetical protein
VRSDSLPLALPITLLPYLKSGEHLSTTLVIADITFSGLSDGETEASTFNSIRAVRGAFLF